MEEGSTEKSKSNIGIIIAVAVVVLCCCVIILAAIGVVAYEYIQLPPALPGSTDIPFGPPTSTPVVEVTRPPASEVPVDTLEALKATIVPENDPYELACRLKGVCDVPKTVPGKEYAVGDQESYWIINSDTNEHSRITATLLYITPHSYFWAENGTEVDEEEMKALMDTFENKIYPTDREFFGSEANPGIDDDEHIFVLYASSIGHNIAGYFSSIDSFNPLVREYSNAHETYVLGTSQDLGNEYTYGTLAHEFVHMIQFPVDRNDVSWLNEGFAEVGVFLNGYYTGGKDWFYAQNPDLQLNTWEDNSSPDFGAHYGQSFLYLTYFLDRFGEEATKALISNPENDLTSVDATLAELNIRDPQTDQLITADDVYMDWGAALYLQDASVGDGRYTYHDYPDAPQTFATETVSDCPVEPLGRTVNQYGLDYIQINCSGDYTLQFKGSTITGLLPEDPYSGSNAFWSNKGDESDMTLTREFDFTDVSGPITFSFRTWYDIEEDWDYIYLEASNDGQIWEILTTPSGTDFNPTGNSYGWGYTGKTNGWIQEDIDLSDYAGEKIFVRFEYITDAAVNGEGMLIDDVSVDAIDYFTDFEADNGGWETDGFARVQNALPQTFRLALIKEGSTTTVEMIEVGEDQTAEIPITIGGDVDSVTLVVSGTTRFTREEASYTVEIR